MNIITAIKHQLILKQTPSDWDAVRDYYAGVKSNGPCQPSARILNQYYGKPRWFCDLAYIINHLNPWKTLETDVQIGFKPTRLDRYLLSTYQRCQRINAWLGNALPQNCVVFFLKRKLHVALKARYFSFQFYKGNVAAITDKLKYLFFHK